MLRSLRINVRLALKHKVYTFINVLGLAVAFACCLLIYLFVSRELSFDSRHSAGIYRITSHMNSEDASIHWVNTPPALAPALRSQYTDIQNVTQLRYAHEVLISVDDRDFFEKKVFYADSSFLEIFNFPLYQGERENALDEPNSVLLTPHLAEKYFGSVNPIGRSILLDNERQLKVTGILAPLRSNEHLDFEMLISFPTYQVPEGYLSNLTSWSWVGFHTYVSLVPGADIGAVEKEIDNQYRARDIPYKTVFQPVRDIYFGSNMMTEAENSPIRSGNRTSVDWLIIVCLLIVVIASFNLMNSTYGLSIKRLREVGVRKVLGVNGATLISVILSQSTLLSVLGFMLGSALAFGLFPWIRPILQWDLNPGLPEIGTALGLVFVLAISVGMIAGFYPSLMLARYDLIQALKGFVKVSRTRIAQSAVITIQLAISVGLILATMIIIRQINYMKTKELGFDKERVVILKLVPEEMNTHYVPLRNALLRNPNIEAVTQTTRLMGESLGVNTMIPSGANPTEGIKSAQILVDHDFMKTMDLQLTDGRFFSRDFPRDSTESIVINETAARLLGLQDPIGQRIQFLGSRDREIIGVMKDFHFSSMHSKIGPLAIVFTFIDPGNIVVRMRDISSGIEFIESTWSSVIPDIPLDLTYYDDHMNQLYNKEEKLSSLISAFSVIAILLAIMGLYGIITLLIANKMKELGIRKVLGGSVFSLMVMLSRKYFILAFISITIGIPVVFQISNRWLDNFYYRVDLPWWLFAGAGLILIILVASTIMHKVLTASRVNPVDIIRSE